MEHDEVRNLSEALAALSESVATYQDSLESVDASLSGPALKKGRRLLQEATEFAADLDATLREIRFLPPPTAPSPKAASALRRVAAALDASERPRPELVARDLEGVLALLPR